ncbi:MAG: DoxX family protein [Gemmatimonadales bacterium]
MRPASQNSRTIQVGRAMSALAILFLLFDTVIKLIQHPSAVEGTMKLGYPEGVILGIGIVELLCLALYAYPRTAVTGAVLLTGYLGGAIATHVRIGSPLLSHTLFPIYVAALLWGGLYLREERLRSLLPVRR